jgi:hypothetical protein
VNAGVHVHEGQLKADKYSAVGDVQFNTQAGFVQPVCNSVSARQADRRSCTKPAITAQHPWPNTAAMLCAATELLPEHDAAVTGLCHGSTGLLLHHHAGHQSSNERVSCRQHTHTHTRVVAHTSSNLISSMLLCTPHMNSHATNA